MCAPAVLPALMIAATVASTALAAKSAADQVQAQNQANAYNASIQNRNAQVSQMQAAETIQEGDIAAKEHLQNVKALIGTQRAEQGASGSVVDTGSNANLNQDAAQFGKLDALTIQSNAARTAWAQTNQGANYTASANLLNASKGSPGNAATGSLLTGVSAIGQQIYAGKNSGMFD
jgi:hypothetical protein